MSSASLTPPALRGAPGSVRRSAERGLLARACTDPRDRPGGRDVWRHVLRIEPLQLVPTDRLLKGHELARLDTSDMLFYARPCFVHHTGESLPRRVDLAPLRSATLASSGTFLCAQTTLSARGCRRYTRTLFRRVRTSSTCAPASPVTSPTTCACRPASVSARTRRARDAPLSNDDSQFNHGGVL